MTATFEWVDAGGNLWGLTDPGATVGLMVMKGVTGADMPPIRHTSLQAAGQPGAIPRSFEHDVRTVTLPILLTFDNEADLAFWKPVWRTVFDPKRGQGVLIRTNELGERRRLNCRYVGGFEGVDDDTTRGDGWIEFSLVFEASDPYWYAEEFNSVRWVAGGDTPKWFSPADSKSILPLRLAPSTVLGASDLEVGSDVPVYPVWTIAGPGAAVTLENGLGQTLRWDGTLLEGDQLVIDARPGANTVILNGVGNAFASLSSWDFWALQPGTNSIAVEVDGASPSTSVIVQWRNAYLGE